MPNYCNGFAFNGDTVALIRKERPAWQRGLLNGIGGHVEKGESYSDAMVREFEEEADMRVESWEPFALMHGKYWECMFFRAFDVPLDQVKTMTDEDVFLFDATRLPTHVIPNLRWLIPLALDPGPMSVLARYGEHADKGPKGTPGA